VEMTKRFRCVVTVEDNVRTGGVGSALAQEMRDADVTTPLRDFGIPARFLDHASRSEVLADIGLTAQDISREVIETISSLDPAAPPVHAVND
jgi:1-deoxy-D-xylulose-5-phosphate synthase